MSQTRSVQGGKVEHNSGTLILPTKKCIHIVSNTPFLCVKSMSLPYPWPIPGIIGGDKLLNCCGKINLILKAARMTYAVVKRKS